MPTGGRSATSTARTSREDAQRPTCSPATRPGASPPTSLSCPTRRAPVQEQRRLYGAAVRQVTAHDDGRGDDFYGAAARQVTARHDGRGDDDAAGIRHDSA